ncbi:hypothetical protein DEO72_LG6g815 [Vigna unguiculata]|uniref:Uncharacterized protein n=1 Tax=Vigna unguiculata TaxID=3917 RepID=A0A4D6M5T4_VIGUN|nr:hypothetical protein DEO72_LG6g815 [Vigna unguiculata]
MATTMFIHLLYLLMMTLRYPLLSHATTRGSTIYKTQLVETRARTTCYGPHSVTSCEVPNMNHNSYSRHKICNITGHNPWLLNQVEIICTSHNLHTHIDTIRHSESQIKEYHVFTLHLEPQLKGYHSESQLKECSSKVHP